MTTKLPFNMKIPVIYVNPPFYTDPGLIESVYRAGGLGIVDRVVATDSHSGIAPAVPHGVRISLEHLKDVTQDSSMRLAVLPLDDADGLVSLESGAFGLPVPVAVEVGSAAQALQAEKAGAAALIARGNEGPGWVSPTSGLVLLQEILEMTGLPVFLQGGVGLRTAFGAMCAGATGIVLDVHLLLASDSALDAAVKKFLGSLSLPATVTLGEAWDRPCRIYSRIGTRIVRELRTYEESLTNDRFPDLRDRVNGLLGAVSGSPDRDEMLIPLSEDIVTAQRLSEAFGDAHSILEAFSGKIGQSDATWPFHGESELCKTHGTRFPIVQGPMAHVSDNPDFLAAVAKEGGLPFLAMGNMPPPIAREGIELSREKTGGNFGVGLIGLEVNRHCYEAHMRSWLSLLLHLPYLLRAVRTWQNRSKSRGRSVTFIARRLRFLWKGSRRASGISSLRDVNRAATSAHLAASICGTPICTSWKRRQTTDWTSVR